MSEYAIVNGKIYMESSVIENGYLIISNGKITCVKSGSYKGQLPTVDVQCSHVLPGFIDIHIHGGYGEDIMDANLKGLRKLSELLLSEGTTSFLPTTMTQSNDNIKRALKNIVKCKNTQDCKTAAEIIGIHLEGPFISKDKVGAQNPRFVETPSINKVEHFQNIADNQIKIITIAPEVKGAEETISRWSENIIFSIGHTLADYEQVNFSVTKGVRHITHLYNASSNFTHRNLGVVGAAWTNNKLSAEIIVDGIHSHPEAIDIAYKLKGNQSLYLITDSMRAKGMPDGEYDLGGQSVTVNHPEARLSTGELAGSILRMIDGFKNLIHFTNGSISDLWPLTSLNQARALNISEAKGSIEIGKDADLVVLKDDISLKMTVKGGTMHYS